MKREEVIWKPIKGYELRYSVSNYGEVKSLSRARKQGGYTKDRILKSPPGVGGYKYISLLKNGKKRNTRIHQLVAQAFIGEISEGMVIHHKDGCKTNNFYTNLEYVSKHKNTSEYYKSQGKGRGKVPINDIENIIKRVYNGEPCISIAREYNVPIPFIGNLCACISLNNKEL